MSVEALDDAVDTAQLTRFTGTRDAARAIDYVTTRQLATDDTSSLHSCVKLPSPIRSFDAIGDRGSTKVVSVLWQVVTDVSPTSQQCGVAQQMMLSPCVLQA